MLPQVEQPATVTTYLKGIRTHLSRVSPATVVAELTYAPHETEPRMVAKVSVRAGGPSGPEDPDDPDEPTRGPSNPDLDDFGVDDDEDKDKDEDEAARTIQLFWRRRRQLLQPHLQPILISLHIPPLPMQDDQRRMHYFDMPFPGPPTNITLWHTRDEAAKTIQRWWRTERSFGLDPLSDLATAAAADLGGEARESENTFPVSHLRV